MSDKEIRKLAAIMFTDMVGYSALSQRDSKLALELLQEHREILREIFPRFHGTEIKTIGDAFLVEFNSALEAAQCAIEIQRTLAHRDADAPAERQIQLRIGIHIGDVIHRENDVYGDGVNIASRIEPLASPGGICLSMDVERQIRNAVETRFEKLAPTELKNISVPMDLFRIVLPWETTLEVRDQRSEIGGQPARRSLGEGGRSEIRESSRMPWHEIVIGILLLATLIGGALLWLHRAGTGGKTASQNPAATTPSIPEKSIAVLPFVNMSEDKTNEFFSDGISEELLNLLAKVPQLQVAARTSSFSFKGKGVEIPEIARQLHVANVLEGSVRKSGDQLRITAQLIRAAEGYHLWSDTYDRKLDDIFKIQDEIAGEVVKELKVKLLGAAPKARTTDPQAYALYLQARELGRQKTAEAFTKSDALYRQVLEIDPRYAPAWNGLARNFNNETSVGVLSNQEGYARAREATKKALAIDPDYAPAHAGLGSITMDADNDPAGAARHYERALALDPTDLDVLFSAANFLQSLGRLDEALTLEEAVVRRDPVNAKALNNLGYFERLAGRYDAAISSLRTLLSLSPNRGGARFNLETALMLRGDATAALAEIEQEKTEVWRMIGLPMAYCALGRKADADAALNALTTKYEKDWAYNIAHVYAFCGDADKAFEWLDKAVAYHDGGLSEIVTENLFDKIHSDPRWLPFLRKIGKAPDQLAKIQFKMPQLQ
jgi:TolB-like protein/class 3 adenylate cyclase/thioredoxin-like negative regulator of GroEL